MKSFALSGLSLILLVIALGEPTAEDLACDPNPIPEWNIILLS